METPCSVKAIGKYLGPPQLEVTICDLKSSNSAFEIGGQSLNSELDPPFVRRSIPDRQIFDATQYLFAPAKNSDPEI